LLSGSRRWSAGRPCACCGSTPVRRHVEPQTALARARAGLDLVSEDSRRSVMGTSGLVGSCASRDANRPVAGAPLNDPRPEQDVSPAAAAELLRPGDPPARHRQSARDRPHGLQHRDHAGARPSQAPPGRPSRQLGDRRGRQSEPALRRAQAAAVLVGLAANAWIGVFWLDGLIGLGLAAIAVREGRSARCGEDCC